MARILLVEPDKTLSKLYSSVLEGAGHQVRWSAGAQPAIIAADEFKPDLVIVELQLAGNNGVEFLYEFRSYADWAKTPVIILSLVPPMESLVGLDVVAYLYKPQTKLKDLLRQVGRLLPVAA
jgi:DNA-binding response OmpR family regulator